MIVTGSNAVELSNKRRRRSLIRAQGWSAATTLGKPIKGTETLKAFADRRTLSGLFSNPDDITPGFLLRSNPGTAKTKPATLTGFADRRTLSGLFSNPDDIAPGFLLRSNPGLKLANAFGVTCLRTLRGLD